MTHNLKIDPRFFSQAVTERKAFEVRKNNRNFKTGDIVILKEYYNGFFTGNECKFFIGFILKDFPGLEDGYICFSLSKKHISSYEEKD